MAIQYSSACSTGPRRTWSLRQNPYANTDQRQMRDFIISQEVISCPWGHLAEDAAIAHGLPTWGRDNVINGTFNEDQNSRLQDEKFIKEMKIGDIVVIPFTARCGIRECIQAEIVSDPINKVETGLFTSMRNGKIQVSTKGDIPFRPVGRKIKIIRTDLIFADKRRVLSMKTLSHINPDILLI